MKKNIIEKKLYRFSPDVLAGSLDEAIARLEAMKLFPQCLEFTTLFLVEDTEYDNTGYGRDYTYFDLYGQREETDEEFEARKRKNAEARKTAKKEKKLKEEAAEVEAKTQLFKLLKKYPNLLDGLNVK